VMDKSSKKNVVVGAEVGVLVVGSREGDADGWSEGLAVGCIDGVDDDAFDGIVVGRTEDIGVGLYVGVANVGRSVGVGVGD